MQVSLSLSLGLPELEQSPSNVAGIFPLSSADDFNDVRPMGKWTGAQPSGCSSTANAKSGAVLKRLGRVVGFCSLKAALLPLILRFSGMALGEDTNAAASRSGPEVASGTNLPGVAAFQIKPGFRIELAASEPMVTAPVAMAFDENGRLFVVEMRDYTDQHAATPHLGRVRMLENMNEEGVFQNSTIYADNLPWPSAVACYAGGVFVAAAPDIFYFKDTKADGIADSRQVVLSGFGGTNALDPKRLPNNFNWGPDNRIHGVSAGIGGDIWSKGADGLVSIERSDFSFDPRTLEVYAETGPAESGLSFDSQGREFVSDYVHPIMSPIYQLRYVLRNPYYPRPSGLAVIADPAAPIFRFVSEPPQPGQGTRTTNLVAGPMTRACGCVVYRGHAFPTNYLDNVFVADPDAHIIHRLIVRENGLEAVAQRAPEERNTEFLVSRDPSFRPVQLINGPDGALYIADMQAAKDRGRIYRVLPGNIRHTKLPQLGKLKTYELISTLAQGDGWHRDTAARLLYERKDPAAPALLRGTLNRSRLTQARVLALQALVGAGALTEDDVLKALRDLDARLREHAVLVSETLFTNGNASEPVFGQLSALIADPSLRVRYQLAFTLGEIQRTDTAFALGQLLGRDLTNPWMRNALLSAPPGGAGNLFAVLAGDARLRNDPAGMEFLRQLATMIGVSGNQDAVNQTATFIARGPLDPSQIYALLYNLGEGLYRTRSSLSLVDTQGALKPFYSSAINLAADPTQPESARAAAAQLLGVSTLSVGLIGDWLLLACNPPSGPALQSAAVETLSRYDDPQVVNGFLEMWPVLMPVARTRAITALLSRDSHVPAVVDAIQNGRISAFDLNSLQRNLLRSYPVPAIRLRALQLLGPVPGARPDVMERFKPALSLRGVSDRGREIFRARCIECHLSAGLGQWSGLGPDLLEAKTFTKDHLLARIIQPNLAVRPDYATQLIESKGGDILVGIISDVNRWTLTLTQIGDNRVVWPQLNVSSVLPLGWSLMPDGLEQGMSAQDMADLMEYVLRGTR
jgi:putative membrane-bound dehydrogenase-like protein